MALPVCHRIAGAYRIYYRPMDTDGGTHLGQSGSPPSPLAAHFIGLTGEEGVRMTKDIFLQFTKADQLGQGDVDAVHQGSNLEIEFVAQDVNRDSVMMLMHPFQTVGGITTPTIKQELYGVPGQLASAHFGTLYMYPVAGSPAEGFTAGATAASGTNALAFTGINVGPVVETYDATPRFVPIRFRAFPFVDVADSSAYKLWKFVANNTEPTAEFVF